jgi:hypothetical protein
MPMTRLAALRLKTSLEKYTTNLMEKTVVKTVAA